ncbi:hypothetical protein CDIK_1455 [Cucumispora dikerogammari]|nr:hypothetical protein CDIK_1455 [Cucumispora dikerogammari]
MSDYEKKQVSRKKRRTAAKKDIRKYKKEAVEALVDKKALFKTIRAALNKDKRVKYHVDNNTFQENSPINMRMEVTNRWINKYGLLNFMSRGELKELYFQPDSVNKFKFCEELEKDDVVETHTNKTICLNDIKNECLYDSRIIFGANLFKSFKNYEEKGEYFVNTIIPLFPALVLTSSQTHSPLSKIITIKPLLITCYDNGLINIFRESRLIYSYNLHHAEIKDCEVSDCFQYICATDKNGRISIVKIKGVEHYFLSERQCHAKGYCERNVYYKSNDKADEKIYINPKIPYVVTRLNSIVEAIVWSGCNLILIDKKGVIRKYEIDDICNDPEFEENFCSQNRRAKKNISMPPPLYLHPIDRYDITTDLIISPRVSVISISNCHRYIFLGGNWSGVLIYDTLETYTTDLEQDRISPLNRGISLYKDRSVARGLSRKERTEDQRYSSNSEKIRIDENKKNYMYISCDRVVDMMYHPTKDSLVVATTGEVFELAFNEISGSKKLSNLNIKSHILRNLKLNPDNLHATINKTIKITENAITMDTKGTNLSQNILRNKTFNGCWERRDIIGYNYHENFIQFGTYEVPDELPFILRTIICHDHILLLLTNNKLMIEHKWCQCLNTKRDFNRGMYSSIDVGPNCIIEVHPKKRIIIIADYDVMFYDLYGKQISNLKFNFFYKIKKTNGKTLIDNLKDLENSNFLYSGGTEYKITDIMFNEDGDQLYVADEMGSLSIYSMTLSEYNNFTVSNTRGEKKKKIREIFEEKEVKKDIYEFSALNFMDKKDILVVDQNFTYAESLDSQLNNMQSFCNYIEMGNFYENYTSVPNATDKDVLVYSIPKMEDDSENSIFAFCKKPFSNYPPLLQTKICYTCKERGTILAKSGYKTQIPLNLDGEFDYETIRQEYDLSLSPYHSTHLDVREPYKILHEMKYTKDEIIIVQKHWAGHYESMDTPQIDTSLTDIDQPNNEPSDTSVITPSGNSNSTKVQPEETEDSDISDLSSFDGSILSDEDPIVDFIDDDVESTD